MIRTLLLLGATGDPSRRYLLPALGALPEAGRLPDGFRVVGGAHPVLDDQGFRRLAGNALPADMLTYRPFDLADPSTLAAALGATTDIIVIVVIASMVLTRSFALCCLGGKLKADEVPDSSLIYTVIALQEGGVLSTFEREQAPIEIASQVDASLIRRCGILRCGDH